jgi:hypothetical protein
MRGMSKSVTLVWRHRGRAGPRPPHTLLGVTFMGIADQFKDKAEALKEREQKAERGAKKEASKRSGKPEEGPRERTTEQAMQDAEDKFRQDYEI